MDYDLERNPFQKSFTFDFDDYKEYSDTFLSDFRTINDLKNKIIWSTKSDENILAKIIGRKGDGKSTVAFYFQDQLRKLDDPSIHFYHLVYNGKTSLQIINELIDELEIKSSLGPELRLAKWLETNQLYLFIDFQDDIFYRDAFSKLSETLIKLCNKFKKISIIIVLNKNQERELSNIHILGKFTRFELKSFDLENTAQLIKLRLEKFRLKEFNGNPLYPFENVVDLIYSYTGGSPRKIISTCDLILSRLDNKSLTREVFSELFQNDLLERILEENTTSELERENLNKLYCIIKNVFDGQVNKQKDLLDYLEKEVLWGSTTSRKRIEKLRKINLLTISTQSDGWTRIIKIRENE